MDSVVFSNYKLKNIKFLALFISNNLIPFTYSIICNSSALTMLYFDIQIFKVLYKSLFWLWQKQFVTLFAFLVGKFHADNPLRSKAFGAIYRPAR